MPSSLPGGDPDRARGDRPQGARPRSGRSVRQRRGDGRHPRGLAGRPLDRGCRRPQRVARPRPVPRALPPGRGRAARPGICRTCAGRGRCRRSGRHGRGRRGPLEPGCRALSGRCLRRRTPPSAVPPGPPVSRYDPDDDDARVASGTSPWAWIAGLLGLAILVVAGFLIFKLLTGIVRPPTRSSSRTSSASS